MLEPIAQQVTVSQCESHCEPACLHSGPCVLKVRARTVRNKALQLIGKATRRARREHGASARQDLMRITLRCVGQAQGMLCAGTQDIMLTV